MTEISPLYILAAVMGQVGRYQLKVRDLRSKGLIRFEPYVPRISQKKRRLNARRAA